MTTVPGLLSPQLFIELCDLIHPCLRRQPGKAIHQCAPFILRGLQGNGVQEFIYRDIAWKLKKWHGRYGYAFCLLTALFTNPRGSVSGVKGPR